MNSLDLIIVLVLAGYAFAGYTHGFVWTLLEGAGLIVGGFVGIVAVPIIFGEASGTPLRAVLSLAFVLMFASFGQFVGAYVGRGLRADRGALRGVDAVGGALLSAAAVLCVAWAVGYAVSAAKVPYISAAVRASTVLETVDRFIPASAGQVLRTFSETLTTDVFPRYLEPFQNEVIVDTAPPDQATLESPGVQAAAGAVVKVIGDAECGRGIEGSGFVYSKNRIMTNAHVVAGVADPVVIVGDRRIKATTVLFDPELDIAVLGMPRLGIEPLEFDTTAEVGDDAAVLGYPENGPFDARAARIRSVIDLRSPDIYDRGQVVREAFAVRSLVRSGNSGGPLVSTSGDVIGVVFAASLSDDETGYALTADQVADGARRGATARAEVDTGKCA